SAAVAQVTTADIVGRVTDSSNAVLPGATVTVENAGTHETRVAPTNESGDYAFTLLPIGTYTIKIELQGFSTQNARLALAAGDRARVDAKLQVGAVAENVTVTGESPLLQTDTATLSSLVTEKAVQDLPVNGRNFVRLVQLVPGATEGVPNSLASGTRPDDRRQTSAISINGALDNQNNQLIDGIDNNERFIGTVIVKPSIDAIAEVKVQTNMYTAEVGRTAGGVVNIVTKSGSNDFHGSLFEFNRNDRFDARNFFATTGPKPALDQNQFGGSAGGPMVRNKAFFFGDFEGFRSTQGVTFVSTVPTAKMRAGDFSEVSAILYDPATTPRTPFSGNLIPSGRLDPIALKYMALYPLPNGAGLANNFTGINNRTQNSSTADIRIDHRFSDASSLFARYSYNNVNTFTPGALPEVNGVQPGGNNGQFPGPNTTKADAVQTNFLHIFSPSLVSEVKVGFGYGDIESLPLNYGANLSSAFGLKNVNIDAITSALTPMNPAGYASLGDATFIPLITSNKTLQVSGSVTRTSGPHNIKIGAGLVSRRMRQFQSSSAVGTIAFSTALTDNGAGTGGNSIASFLLGYPATVARTHTLFDPHYRTMEPGGYVQDDWRATSWLTVNAGLRYDIYTPLAEANNNLSNIDLSALKLLIAGQSGVSEAAGVNTDYSNLAPRIGFSATLPRDTVLRGGWGLAYFPGNYMSQSLMKNPPFVSTYGPVTSTGASGGLPNLLLSNGLPLPTPTDAVNLAGTIIGVEQDFKNTRVQQFNLIAEKQFAGNVVGAGYVGSRGAHVAFAIPNLDLAPAGPGAIQPRRLFAAQLPNVTTIGMFESDFESTYNAMQLVFQRRHRSGLTLGSNYTLAHTMWTSPTPNDVNVIERFDADFDVRHKVVFSANYELPFGQQFTGAAKQIFAGWQVNGIAYWQSGLPFTVTNSTARSNTSAGGDRPNVVGTPELGHPTIAGWFDITAFAAQPINTIGNAGRNILHGPPNRRLDLSLFKTVDLAASVHLQLRIEGYNVTNTPSFANPNAGLGAPGFGTITSTGNSIPRQMQFAA
ncbi:MAG TPA: carboxypeptidase regulatory-like domain-containing protein, partial [Vicinamibacterales bacterium]|nr:carboxypeptidase regulatory-like domain-containing protein [Vicinamibacterales bacterium]